MIENKTGLALTDGIKDYIVSYLLDGTDSLETVIDKVNTSKRNIFLADVEEETGAAIETLIRLYNEIDNELEIPKEERVPIKIFVNSNGGALESALTICDAISLSSTPIWTINTGKAYSCGALIFLCGHKRYTFPNASFLIHEGSVNGRVAMDRNKFDNFSDFYKTQVIKTKGIICEKTLISEELYSEHEKDDWWFDANTALELKVADEVVTPEVYAKL
jgi:ATP-dependent protease ClpP protease subunit